MTHCASKFNLQKYFISLEEIDREIHLFFLQTNLVKPFTLNQIMRRYTGDHRNRLEKISSLYT